MSANRSGLGAPPGEARRRANGQSTYQRLLDASLELWGREGIQSVTMSAVAALAGKTRRTAYHHFPDRQALIAATVHYLDDRLVEIFRDAADDDAHPYLVVTELAADHPHLFRPYLVDVLGRDPNKDRLIQVAIAHFRAFGAKGRLQEGIDPAYVAMMSVSLCFAAMLSVGLGKTQAARRAHALKFARAMQHMMFHGLIRPQKEGRPAPDVPANTGTRRAAKRRSAARASPAKPRSRDNH